MYVMYSTCYWKDTCNPVKAMYIICMPDLVAYYYMHASLGNIENLFYDLEAESGGLLLVWLISRSGLLLGSGHWLTWGV